MNWRRTVTLAIFIAGVTSTTSIIHAQQNEANPFAGSSGSVYTESNATANSVLVFSRAANGTLTQTANVVTGGTGGGVVSVGSQGALALSQDKRWLFVVNEGGSISVMERTPAGLKAGQTISSNGTLPVSLTVSRNLVYVLNDGVPQTSQNPVAANISGFYFDNARGRLTPIPNSTRYLSAPFPTVPGAGPIAPDIQFDNTGSFLYVAEVGTSLIDKYSIDFNGAPSEDETLTSFGNAPFDLAFDPRDNLLVTEIHENAPASSVGPGAVTSYQLNREGGISAISGSVPDFESAPCWLVITTNGRFAYAVNTASSVISGYQVGFNGELSLLGNGVTAKTVAHPLDVAITPDSRYLYNVTGSGTLAGYQVQSDGSLTPLTQTPPSIPTTSRGLVAE